ncbi:MAG: ATP-binding protein [Chloroflexota bacterium]
MDPAEIQNNVTLEQAVRRANLLTAAAKVSQNITQILNIDELLPQTVDIICEAYGFYYAGVFLIDEAGEFAVLRAGRGKPGQIMIENNHKLAVGGNSMIGACTARNEARISLDVDTERVWYPNPVLPDTRSEVALPLAVGQKVIGAVTVQSVEAAAFSDEDIFSLQAMANQLAIAIDNARQRRELEKAHAQLVQAKTFEAIATATGDAIHWIGNKAEPIGGSVNRLGEDIQLLGVALARVLETAPDEVKNAPLAYQLRQEAAEILSRQPHLSQTVEQLDTLSPDRLAQRLSLASILEDLQIINTAASLILKVKEELIGPAREQAPRPVMVIDVINDALTTAGIWPEMVTLSRPRDLPLVLADPAQLNRVFVNLFKNVQEALAGQPTPKLTVSLHPDPEQNLVLIDVVDNGPGIAAEDLDKIWITFHTTKNVNEHAGLGLPACRLILEHIGGYIAVASQPGQGATFTVAVPIAANQATGVKIEPGRGKILLLDDADDWRHFAAITLKTAGYKVSTSGPAYKTEPYRQYDLILVDDILAERDSLELLAEIKKAGAIAKTVVISSNPRVERAKAHKLLGIYDLLPKPYTQVTLLNEVLKAINSTRYSRV